MRQDFRTPATFCPYCAMLLDTASLGYSDGLADGAYSVCIGCFGFLRFDQNFKLRVVSDEAYRRLCAKDPQMRNAVAALRWAIADAHADLGRPSKSIGELQWRNHLRNQS